MFKKLYYILTTDQCKLMDEIIRQTFLIVSMYLNVRELRVEKFHSLLAQRRSFDVLL